MTARRESVKKQVTNMGHPRNLCIHGHFYQPPRENPWLGVVETQDSAAPYHDWNERITRECYAPNTRARLLDGQGRIVNRVSRERRGEHGNALAQVYNHMILPLA